MEKATAELSSIPEEEWKRRQEEFMHLQGEYFEGE